MNFQMLSTAQPALPSPSEVRDRVLAQHEALRVLLHHALAVAAAAHRGLNEATEEVMPLLHDIGRRMLFHMAFEESALVPLLRTADSWGEARAQRVLDDHAHQRLEFESLVTCESWEDGSGALILETLVCEILIDMEVEERDVLSPDLLRDDPITIDQCSG